MFLLHLNVRESALWDRTLVKESLETHGIIWGMGDGSAAETPC
jgi:hypothetical protein